MPDLKKSLFIIMLLLITCSSFAAGETATVAENLETARKELTSARNLCRISLTWAGYDAVSDSLRNAETLIKNFRKIALNHEIVLVDKILKDIESAKFYVFSKRDCETAANFLTDSIKLLGTLQQPN